MSLPLPLPIEPMLARAVPEIPRTAGAYAYEPKWDGFRCIAARDGEQVDLWSRSRKSLTRFFPEMVAELRRWLPEQVILDGELVVRSGPPGAERLDWDALSLRLHPAARRIDQQAAENPASFVVFDLLALGDVDLTSLPYATRRAALAEVLAPLRGSGIHLTAMSTDPDVAAHWFATFEGAGLDGIVVKHLDASYSPGARTMLKVKHWRTAEAVVIGFSRSRTGHGVGSLHLGLYDESGTLLPVGGIGGLPDAARGQIEEVLAPLVLTGEAAARAPAPSAVSRAGIRDFVPVHPELVVEVRFNQLEGNRFRYAVTFQRWRPDRDPRSCLLSQVDRAAAYDLGTVLDDESLRRPPD